MKISEWNLERRFFIASILEDLIKSNPDNKTYELILDGFYSQQMFIEHLINLLKKMREELKMTKTLLNQTSLVVKDADTIYGNRSR